MMKRTEYPRPQFVRENWKNLNGEWQFAFDDKNQGIKEKWFETSKELEMKIQVPFVYQCKLSGISSSETHEIVWYKKKFEVKKSHTEDRVILHFGAVDYEATVYVNGQMVCEHVGGHTSFSVDVTEYLTEGMQEVTVRVYDPLLDEEIPRGKQFWEKQPRGIWYTGSTGIWQTVWLECISEKHIEQVKFTSLFDDGKVNIRCAGAGCTEGDRLYYKISYKKEKIAEGTLFWCAEILDWDVDIIRNRIFMTNFHDAGCSWTPETPNLFDVELIYLDENGKEMDKIQTYFGFRKIHIENGKIYLNNKPYYQRLILDQGYWPDGLMTAPSDEALKTDIELSKAMGFNGCRKHQKMEDPRFLYWADKLGYLVWGECASAPIYSAKAVERLANEWFEAVERDYNHPSIVVWVPLNESWGIPYVHQNRTQQHFSQMMYHMLHAIDPTRLVISNDGWEATETDICAVHNYMHGQKEETEKYAEFKKTLFTKESMIERPSTCWSIYANGFSNQGEPVMLTEFGGICFMPEAGEGWGYTMVQNEADFLEDYKRVMDAVYASEGLNGFCYTQLCDVEQEKNGLLTYDRKQKCSLEKIKKITDRRN